MTFLTAVLSIGFCSVVNHITFEISRNYGQNKKVVAAPPVVKKTPNKYRSAKFASYKTPLWAWKFTAEGFIFRSRLITPLWVNFKVLTSRLISLFKTTWNQISMLCNFFKRQIHHSLKHRTVWNSEIWKQNCKQIKKNISRFFFVNAEHYPGFLNPNNHNTTRTSAFDQIIKRNVKISTCIWFLWNFD